MNRRRALSRLVTLALLAGLAVWGLPRLWPWLQHATRVVRLMREAPPASLPVPVEGVERKALRSTWGAARSGGRVHEGIDIFAPLGTPVRSTTHGLVVRKGWNRLGGRVVTVLGPGGQSHYYAHLDEFDTPEERDWVEAGTVLGYVGTSGNAAGTPAHLHYGIYDMGGQARDPYPLLAP
jgi:murein DD-endopeptidase MepM/ murein hydrolase activator NlpD